MKKLLILLTIAVSYINNVYSISTEIRPVTPNEVYGPKDASIELLLGNGGAGPTCLIQELAEDFIRHNELNIKIGWIQTITRLTLENLKEGVIDMSLTYETEPELSAINEGFATERTLVFNDHFILVGPKSNPAGVSKDDTVEEAFNKIANSKSSFFSRNDLSGTNERERMVWNTLQLKPWENLPSWYITEKLFPAESLIKSDKEGHYTLTDRGTLLATKAELSNTAVYLQNDEVLMNRCHAMLQKNPRPYAKLFLNYLKSDRAQSIISVYSGKKIKNCIDCCPLFTRAKEDQFLEKECLERHGLSPLDSNDLGWPHRKQDILHKKSVFSVSHIPAFELKCN